MPDTTEIDLRVFCATAPHGKYDLTKPFVRSSWRYATDGRVAIRVSDGGPDTEGTFPKVESVFENFPVCDQPLPVPETVEIDCRRCGASGRVPGKCEMCGGPMEVCFVCSGVKRVMARKGVLRVDCHLFDPWYLYLIEGWTKNVRHAAAMREDRLCFTADGGVQIVLHGTSPE